VSLGTAVIDTADYVAAIKAGVRAVNASGGINGHPVVFTPCNDKGDPNQATTCARQYSSDGTVATIGNISSFGANVAPILANGGVAQVGLFANSQPEYTCSTCFPLSGVSSYTFAALIKGIKDAGGKSVYFVGWELPIFHGFVPIIKAMAQKEGVKWAGETFTPVTQTDFAPTAAKIRESGADFVIPSMPETATKPLIQAVQQSAVPVKWGIFASILSTGTMKELSSALDGGEWGAPVPPLSAASQFPLYKTFLKDLAAEKASGDSTADITKMTISAPDVYTSFTAFASVAKQMTGAINKQTFLAAFQKAQDIDLGGVVPPWTPGRFVGIMPRYTRVSNPNIWLAKIQNGQPVLSGTTPFDVSSVLPPNTSLPATG
jgi:ABC-type branched-subunit amino acid transport system substrate-binding protein